MNNKELLQFVFGILLVIGIALIAFTLVTPKKVLAYEVIQFQSTAIETTDCVQFAQLMTGIKWNDRPVVELPLHHGEPPVGSVLIFLTPWASSQYHAAINVGAGWLLEANFLGPRIVDARKYNPNDVYGYLI